jgi:hypothetical protein
MRACECNCMCVPCMHLCVVCMCPFVPVVLVCVLHLAGMWMQNNLGNSEAIEEDNWVHQLSRLGTASVFWFMPSGLHPPPSPVTCHAHLGLCGGGAGKKVVMMGDDTWLSLFPSGFHRAYGYPSFNVS